MSKHTGYVSGREENGERYMDAFTIDGTRDHAIAALQETLLPGEAIQMVREGDHGGADLTMRGES